jgi:hypothetical protein
MKALKKTAAFQAEYEGSIPFTRSNALVCGRLLRAAPQHTSIDVEAWCWR